MLALRLLWRNWRSGELRVLSAALVLAVTVVAAISVLTDRVEGAMQRQSQTLLGANLVVRSSQPFTSEWLAAAATEGVRVADTVQFASMVFANDEMHLASVKAVSEGYPLLGQLKLSTTPFAVASEQIHRAEGIPPRGEVWVDSRLLPLLHISLGEQIEVGDRSLRVTQLVIEEPDRGGGFSAIGARVLMNAEDVESTGVVQPGSRVQYRLLLGGSEAQLANYQQQIKPLMSQHHRIIDIETSQRGLARSLQTGRKFLLLASMIGVLLAGVAIAMAARRFAARQVEQVALIKSLGCSRGAVMRLYAVQLILLGVVTALVGMALGELLQRLIAESLATLFPVALGPARWSAYLPGAFTGLVCLLCFSVPPLWHLPAVPPLKILRRELPVSGVRYYSQALIGLLAMLGLVALFSGDLQLTAITGAAMLLLVSIGVLFSLLLLRLAQRLAEMGSNWRLALAGLKRNRQHSVIQVMVFGLAVTLLLTLTGLRTSLLDDWQQQLPEGTPNHFLLNIAGAEMPVVERLLAARQLQPQPFYPMVRARLTHINKAPTADLPRSKSNVLRREVNLSWADSLASDNKLLQGQWWSADRSAEMAAVSVEQEVARELGLQLGDQLRFSIGGLSLEAVVQSVRSVEWDSMHPNFYFLLSPGALDDFSPMALTSVYIPATDKLVINELLSQLPTVVVIEMDRVIAQIQAIVSQVSEGVEWVLLVVLVAGFLVMWASVSAGMDERLQEVALLRAMGSKRSRLLGSLWAEFSLLGLFSGIMGVAGSELMLWSIQFWMLDSVPQWHPQLWLLGIVLATALIGAMGVFACRRVVLVSPQQILREFS